VSAATEVFEDADDTYQPVSKTRAERRKAGQGNTSWYIQDLLPKGRLINVAAPYSAGKTTLVIDMMAHAILGWDWHEHKHQIRKLEPDKARIKVLFVTAEGGIEPQLDAWEEHREAIIPDELFVINDEFAWEDNGTAQTTLEDEIHHFQPHILVFDTHNAVGFTEDDPALWSDQIAWLRKLMRELQDLTIIVIHHFGKQFERGMRGLSAVAASSDLIYEISPLDADGDAIKDIRKIKEAVGFEFDREKNRCGGRWMPSVRYKIEAVELGEDEWGDPLTGAVLGEFELIDPDEGNAANMYRMKAAHSRIVKYVRENPGCAAQDIAEALKMQPPYVSKCAKQLEEDRQLFSWKDGKFKRYKTVATDGN